jgi:hypothetical protein
LSQYVVNLNDGTKGVNGKTWCEDLEIGKYGELLVWYEGPRVEYAPAPEGFAETIIAAGPEERHRLITMRVASAQRRPPGEVFAPTAWHSYQKLGNTRDYTNRQARD